MDLGNLIVMLILLAIFGFVVYFGYQKVVVEGDLFKTQETVELPTTPSDGSITAPGEVMGGVSGVDNKKGRPAFAQASYNNDPACNWVDVNGCPNRIPWYGSTENVVPAGQAKTADVCRDFSRSVGLNHWGWNRRDKSCFAYIDSSFLNAMSTSDGIEEPSKYIVGCTDSGVKVLDGCRDMTKGDVVWGAKPGVNVYDWQTNDPIIQSWGGIKSFEACRQEANDKGYDMFIYRGSRDPNASPAGFCGWNKRPETFKGFTGNYANKGIMTACTDPSKKVVDGCE